MKFTTSWDDGHPLDRRMAALLTKYGASGTFYVARNHEVREGPLSEDLMREVGHAMEIGAHTIHHTDVTAVSLEQAREEIRGSKEWVERVLGKECTMFAYPWGRWNDRAKQIVQEAGFKGARTTEVFRLECDDPYRLGATLQVYPFPLRPVWNRRCIQRLREWWPEIRNHGISLLDCRSWTALAKALFRRAQERHCSFFHIYGHSWEMEKYGLWGGLEEFLTFVANQRDIEHVPNSAMIP